MYLWRRHKLQHGLDALYAVFNTHVPPTDPLFDLNSDTVVGEADLDLWLNLAAVENGYFSPYLRGDTDLDHDVDTFDLTQMIMNYTGAIGSDTTWLTGDTDGDGDTDTVDLTTAIINFTGARNAAAAVPEPSSLLLLVLAVGNVVLCRIRQQRMRCQELFAFLLADRANENVSPADLATMRLQHDWSFRG